MSLSRLWQRQGKRAKARPLLAEVYNWFTEGWTPLTSRRPEGHSMRSDEWTLYHPENPHAFP
jgi:hypothetical protein